MKSTESKRVALESLRYAYEKTYEASNILDGKLQNILGFSSIMVSIASAVMGSTLLNNVGISFWFLLALVLLLYVFTFLLILSGLRPRHFYLPVSENLETIKKQYYNSTEDRALEQAIVDHIH